MKYNTKQTTSKRVSRFSIWRIQASKNISFILK